MTGPKLTPSGPCTWRRTGQWCAVVGGRSHSRPPTTADLSPPSPVIVDTAHPILPHMFTHSRYTPGDVQYYLLRYCDATLPPRNHYLSFVEAFLVVIAVCLLSLMLPEVRFREGGWRREGVIKGVYAHFRPNACPHPVPTLDPHSYPYPPHSETGEHLTPAPGYPPKPRSEYDAKGSSLAHGGGTDSCLPGWDRGRGC